MAQPCTIRAVALRATVRALGVQDATTHAPLRSQRTSGWTVYRVHITRDGDYPTSPSKDTKAVLDAIREEVRRRNYLPIVFDFEKPARRDLTETISTLAHMARFVIADLTDAKSIPQELERIVPDLPSVPVQPILQASAEEFSMFEHFTRYPWVLETYRYEGLEEVIASLTEKIIAPAELKANELLRQMRR